MRTTLAMAACAALTLGLGAAQAQNSADIVRSLTLQNEMNSAAPRGATRGIGVTAGGGSTTTGDARVETSVSAAPQDDRPLVTPASLGGDVPDLPRDVQVNLKITFETGSAYIRPSSARLLGELCTALKQMPVEQRFFIIGHADASGAAETNRRLSQARAEEVSRHLQRECGVDQARLRPVGLGETRLLEGVPPISEENRRVEIAVDNS